MSRKRVTEKSLYHVLQTVNGLLRKLPINREVSPFDTTAITACVDAAPSLVDHLMFYEEVIEWYRIEWERQQSEIRRLRELNKERST